MKGGFCKMYVLTVDKKTIMEFGRIEVVKSGKKYILHACSRATLASPVILAEYDEEEKAIEEIQNIKNALIENRVVYEVD